MRPTRRVYAIAFCATSFLALIVGAGCSQKAPAGAAPAAKGPLPVRTAQPRQQTINRVTEQPARIDAFEQTPIYVKIPGYVERVCVEMGTRVKQGELLAELSVPEVREEFNHKNGLVEQAKIDITLSNRMLDVAQANTKTSESLVEETKFSLKRAQANEARWKSESLRMEELVRDKVIDTQSRDETLNQFRAAAAAREEADAKYKSAQAFLVESQAKWNKANTEVLAARNRLELAEVEKRRVAAMLNYAQITCPLENAIVSARNINKGDFLQPSSGRSAKSEPLFVVVRMDKVRVFVDVPEADAVLVKYGSKDACIAHIRVPKLNDKEFTGKVVGSSWSLERSERTMRIEIDFDNPDELLRPGMYAQAVIEQVEPNAWMIPVSAVLVRDGQTYGFILADGKAVKTLVRVGAREGDQIQLLKKLLPVAKPGQAPKWTDIAGGESFILDGVSDLKDGQEVVSK